MHDSENIEFELLLYDHNLPLHTKNGSALKPLTLFGNIQAGNVKLRSSGGEIALDSTNDGVNVSLHNLKVDISSNAVSQGSSGKTSAIALQGENLTLDIKGRKLLAQTLSLHKDKKGNLTGKITNGNSIFNIQYNGTLLSILGTRITDKILNALLATNAFDGGVYTLLAEYQQEILKVNLNILKGTVKDLVGLQNMIAFIDTIPSLLMFKTPDFDQDGYKVESGSLDVEINGDSLLVRKMELNGNSLDIVGNG
ncbi:MAG: AsmA-like C-terminal domain-containing protein, partial [Helicobacter sp.]|nr:AsmA-like C-terminal domain-containing protein [Helicobacter sp.]